MIKVEAFKQAHLDGFVPREVFFGLRDQMLANQLHQDRTVLSLLKDDKLICLAGAIFSRKGSAEVWIIPSKLINECKHEFVKTINGIINNLVMGKLNCHRVTMAVEPTFAKACKFAKILGFKKEGLMKAYSDTGIDHILYAKVKV